LIGLTVKVLLGLITYLILYLLYCNTPKYFNFANSGKGLNLVPRQIPDRKSPPSFDCIKFSEHLLISISKSILMKYFAGIVVIAILSILYANSGGRASTMGQGNTGAPGDETFLGVPRTCQSCHNSTAIQVTLDIEFMDTLGMSLEFYRPGENYLVRVRINPEVGEPRAYGFQMVSLMDRDTSDVASWNDVAENVKIAMAFNGRFYAEHAGPSESNEFLVGWQAPEEGSGSVTFYSAGNGVNRNGDNSGDGAAVSTLTVQEEVSTSAAEILSGRSGIYPNPASDHVIFSEEGMIDFQVFTPSGARILGGQAEGRIDLPGLMPGFYYLHILPDDNVRRIFPLVIH
jgi:hypothetical protein